MTHFLSLVKARHTTWQTSLRWAGSTTLPTGLGGELRVPVNNPKLEMQLEKWVGSHFLKHFLQNTHFYVSLCWFFSVGGIDGGILRKMLYFLLATPLFSLYVSLGNLNNAKLNFVCRSIYELFTQNSEVSMYIRWTICF